MQAARIFPRRPFATASMRLCRSRPSLPRTIARASRIAGQNDEMQRDDWYETARDPLDLVQPAMVGRRAGERAMARVGARKIPTTQAPVLFEAPIASGLMGHLVGAVSGGALYRKS